MKTKKIISLVLISLLAVMTGCMVDSSINGFGGNDNNNTDKIHGSGKLVTLIKDYKDFNGIDLNSGFHVKVIKGNTYFVSIEVDDNIEEYVNTYQSGSKVYISLASGNSYSNVTLNVVIQTPDLETIKANGGAAIEFTGAENYDNLSMELNGGSTVNGTLNINSLVLKLNGGSIVDLTGTGKNLNIFGNGGAIFNLYKFQVEKCDISFNGGCIAYLNVTDRLDASLSGGSIVKYKGNPTIGSISVSGGSIIQRDN